MTTTAGSTRGTARRTATLLVVLAVSLGGMLAPAFAVDRAVEEGALSWGFKSSFRNYVGRQTAALPPIGPTPEGERITVSDGAAFDLAGTPTFPSSSSDPNETLPYLFSASGGAVTDADNLVVRTVGAVTYHFPSHHFELRLSNLAVVVETGTARLVGDVYQLATEDFGQFEKGEYRVTGATIATIGAVDVMIEGDAITVHGTGLKVHAEAAAALPQEAGEELDSFTLTASLREQEPGGGESPPPSPGPEPEPEPEPGELAWRVEGSTVSLGTASVTDEGFVATAALAPVVVTDSRAGGPAWQVSAQVSDFTSDEGVLRGKFLGWVPAILEPGGGARAGEVVSPGLPTGKGLSRVRTLGSAPRGHAAGTATLGGTLELRAPLGTDPGSYRAVLTLTAVG